MTLRLDRWRWSGVALLLVIFLPAGLEAKVARIEILSRTDVLAGRPFGLAGPYEKVVGRVHFAVDPLHPANRRIVDLALAPRNRQGMVEFSADLYLLRPKQADKTGGAGQPLIMPAQVSSGCPMVA